MSLQPGQLEFKLQSIATAVRALAGSYQQDSQALLALLRQLEQLHREIRDGMFQASLPDNRQDLYALLKDIESEGGWPYIERMKLQSFLGYLHSQLEAQDGDRASWETTASDGTVELSDEQSQA